MRLPPTRERIQDGGLIGISVLPRAVGIKVTLQLLQGARGQLRRSIISRPRRERHISERRIYARR